MNIYYYAHKVYQFSNAMPIFHTTGGTLLIGPKFKDYLQYKYYLRTMDMSPHTHTFLKTPPVIRRDKNDVRDLEGVLISLSNTTIGYDHKKLKTIFIGHGTGDKKYGGDASSLKCFDYHFISGPKHLEKLKDVGLNFDDKKLIKIGNLRFDEYINGHIDREHEMNSLGVKDRKRKNILYAPTWRWGHGTFKKYACLFAEQITKKYNLIIRPHHHDRRYLTKMKAWARLHRIKHVYFSNPAQLAKCDTMHDFAVSDLMISDTSSILYEYLVTRNPIIVATTDFDDLHTMPDEMNIMNHTYLFDGSQKILDLIDTALSDQNIRSEYDTLLQNCFYFNDGKSVQRAVDFLNTLT